MITKKTEYAIRAVWELAQGNGNLKTAGQVAEAQEIPPKYLPQIVAELVQAGLLVSSRGYRGGLRLNRERGEITLLDIIEAIQGRLDLFECQQADVSCQHLPECQLRCLYNRAQQAMEGIFKETRLKDIQLGKTGLNSDAE
jgi:Rrf2 family protein